LFPENERADRIGSLKYSHTRKQIMRGTSSTEPLKRKKLTS
jgi:hypothetical protein